VFTASVAGPARGDNRTSTILHAIGKAETKPPSVILFWNRPEALLLKLGSSTVGSTIFRATVTGQTYEHIGQPIKKLNRIVDFKAGTLNERENKNNPDRDLSSHTTR
jgi:hypothetical protein